MNHKIVKINYISISQFHIWYICNNFEFIIDHNYHNLKKILTKIILMVYLKYVFDTIFIVIYKNNYNFNNSDC